MNQPLIINFFGGPGASKSTAGSDVFAALKRAHVEVELAPEVAKLPTYRGDRLFLTDQARVFAEQNHYLEVWRECGVECVVCDSPLLLSLAYARPGYYPAFEPLVWDVWNSYRNLNFFVERPPRYSQLGRSQSPDEAREVDRRTREILARNKVPVELVRYDQAGERAAQAALRVLRPTGG